MISILKRAIARGSRAARARLLNRVLRPAPTHSVLDLGGGKGRHMAEFLPELRDVTIADFNPSALAHAAGTYGFKTRQVDGSEELPFANAEFDLVFCSSVIEHVTGPKVEAVEQFKACGTCFRRGAWQHQLQFASEIRRIGKAYWVQTPNRDFPVEVHSWIPLIAGLPSSWQWAVMKVFNRFWPRKDDQPDWSLLTRREMQELFPDAKIYAEWWGPWVKSWIAVRT